MAIVRPKHDVPGKKTLVPPTRRYRRTPVLERQWKIVALLHGTRYGRTAENLFREVGSSRATFYRDLATLRAAGVPIDTGTVNGEARHRLLGDGYPALVPSLQELALRVACHNLEHLRGTTLFREIERLRDRPPGGRPPVIRVDVAPARALDERVLALLERGLLEHRTLSFTYRGTRDAAGRERQIAPLSLRLAKGQVYLGGHDLERGEPRTFKVARISAVKVGEKFDPTNVEGPSFDHAVVAWSGETVEVVVRVAPEAARFVDEYPLVQDQTAKEDADGSRTVTARVAGIEEALRWVLGWGQQAEVVSPPSLRDRVRQELGGSLSRYSPRPRRARTRQGVAPELRLAGGRG